MLITLEIDYQLMQMMVLLLFMRNFTVLLQASIESVSLDAMPLSWMNLLHLLEYNLQLNEVLS